MNKTRNKGFTLVELLAVIVILAVVILIAVTAVVPRMNNAKKKAFLDEALVYMKAAKEAYVTDPSTECYNISDMGNLVKQNKDGYSGTVYVNEKGVNINITNGKHYLKVADKPIENDIKSEKPSDFISTCSETGTNYTITYDLPNDATVTGTNPSTYNRNTTTITLINPTRPGYKFVGWSSKNLVKLKSTTSTSRGITVEPQSDGSVILNGIKEGENPVLITDYFDVKANVKYRTSIRGDVDGIVDYGLSGFGKVKQVNHVSDFNSGGVQVYIDDGTKVDNVRLYPQIELEFTLTDYQEYMEPTTTAKIYRGSTGNKTFVANWEAL